MDYPFIEMGGNEEFKLYMKPPKEFKDLVSKINNVFKNNFEKRTLEILQRFNVCNTKDPTFLWDDRGLCLVAIHPQYGFYLKNFEDGFKYKNVGNPQDALAFFNIISLYYQALMS